MKKCIAFLCLTVMMISMLCACGMNAVKKTEEAIDAIGEVRLDSEGAIQTAKDLYLALDEEKQEKVSNRDKLEAAEKTLRDLKIQNAEDLIDQIGAASSLDKETIDAARAAFDALDADAQAQVQNADALVQAEEKAEMLEHLSDYLITNYQGIGTKKVSLFDLSTESWFGSDDTAATAYICFLLQGNNEKSIDLDMISFDVDICICRADNRIDIYAKYGKVRDGLLGIQYWPEESRAQVGTVITDLSVEDYANLLIAGGVIDAAREIPLDNCVRVLNTMRG